MLVFLKQQIDVQNGVEPDCAAEGEDVLAEAIQAIQAERVGVGVIHQLRIADQPLYTGWAQGIVNRQVLVNSLDEGFDIIAVTDLGYIREQQVGHPFRVYGVVATHHVDHLGRLGVVLGQRLQEVVVAHTLPLFGSQLHSALEQLVQHFKWVLEVRGGIFGAHRQGAKVGELEGGCILKDETQQPRHEVHIFCKLPNPLVVADKVDPDLEVLLESHPHAGQFGMHQFGIGYQQLGDFGHFEPDVFGDLSYDMFYQLFLLGGVVDELVGLDDVRQHRNEQVSHGYPRRLFLGEYFLFPLLDVAEELPARPHYQLSEALGHPVSDGSLSAFDVLLQMEAFEG